VFASSVTTQLQLILVAIVGWMNRHQQALIEYLQEENRVLLEQLGGKPKRFSDAQRMRLARRGKAVGRHHLGQLCTIVTPDTLLRLFRMLIAKKWTYARTNPLGRPRLDPELEKLVLKLIQQNPT
jgi:putative transposase